MATKPLVIFTGITDKEYSKTLQSQRPDSVKALEICQPADWWKGLGKLYYPWKDSSELRDG